MILVKFMIKFLNYFLQATIIYFLLFFGRIIGVKLGRSMFSFIFLYFAHYFKSKKVINKNLKIFKKDITSIEKNKILSSMWKNYGMTFVEYIFLDRMKKNSSHIEIKGKEILKDIIEGKKQAIFISGHFANFELMSMEITKRNVKLATIYRPLNNFFLNPLMEYLRKKYVCNNQIKKGIKGVREVMNYIKNGFSIALMIDQRVSEGEKVNFFGQPAYTTTLPAQLALKYKLPIIPVFIERDKNSKFIIEFQKEIDIHNYKNKIDLTLKLNEILESMIRKNPNQWIWTHNRWK
tara:strand:+ start:292 stop:1167 length:876 start_codon:yes stop_codon:yes gene_type:complete